MTYQFRGFFLTLMISLASFCIAQGDDLENWFRVKRISGTAISPSGSRILYRIDESDVANDTTISTIWIMDSTGKNVKKVADDAISPRWSPDDKQFAFLDKKKGYQLAVLAVDDPGDRTILTEAPAGVWSFEWSPDAKSIAYISPIPAGAQKSGPIVMSEGGQNSGLYVVDLATKKSRLLTRRDRNIHIAFGQPSLAWSPDGKEIAFAIQEDQGFDGVFMTDLHALSVDDGSVRRLIQRPGIDCCPAWSSDGSRIAFFSSYGAVDRLANCGVSVVAANGGKPNDVGKSLEAGFFDSGGYTWDAENRRIYWEVFRKAYRKLVAVDGQTGAFEELPNENASLAYFSFSRDKNQVAFRQSTPGKTWQLHLAKLNSWKSQQLTNLNNDLKLPLPHAELIHWRSGGHPIEAILLTPAAQKAGEKYPLIVMIHAGPEVTADWSFDISWFGNFQSNPNVLQYLASRGYAVLIPNFRGSGGYGEKFRRAMFQKFASATLQDIREGIRHLSERNLILENKVGLMGWSYGGFAIAWMLGQTSEFQAVIPGAPVADLQIMYGEGELDLWVSSFLGGPPWKVRQQFERHSPISNLHKGRMPTLIVHGQNDSLVPVIHGKTLYHVLKEQGTPVELLLYPNQDHSFTSPKFMKDLTNRVEAWFARWLLGR